MVTTRRRVVKARKAVKRAPSRSMFATSLKQKNRRYLVGFTCYNHRYGCECTIDVPRNVKANFKRKYGIDYDEYCYYTLVEAPSEDLAEKWSWDAQGATDNPHEIWEDAEVIGIAR